LTSSKPAYLTAAFGAVRVGGAGTPIALAAAGERTNIRLSMPRGGAIAGVIRDKNGAPTPDIQVTVSAVGTAPFGTKPNAFTDERGAYRIFGLAPGAYLVYVSQPFSGGIGEIGDMSTAEVDAVFARLHARPPAIAGAPTPTPATPPARSPSSIVRPDRTFGTAAVFFPGVATPAAALPITLALGEVRESVDFAYTYTRTVMVTGNVNGAGAIPVRLTLNGENTSSNQISFGTGPILQRRASSSDGEFTFTNVSPGNYTLIATAAPGSAGGRGAPIPTGPTQSFAMAEFEITGDDITGLDLTMRPTLNVTGRVSFAGAAPSAEAQTSLVVRLLATGSGQQAIGGQGAVRPDGSFEVNGIIPAEYRVSITGVPAGWVPRSATLGDRDLLDLPVRVGAANLSGLEILLTDQRSQISGRLTDTSGAAAPGYFVAVFSADQAMWVPQSRRIKSVRPDTSGAFHFDDLPAGEYYVAALTEGETSDWQQPASLTQIIPAAVKVTLAEGERKTQNLQIARY
jgi:hypothetical protein